MNIYLKDAIKHIKSAGYQFKDANTMENESFRITFEVDTPSAWNTNILVRCYRKETGMEEPCTLFPTEAQIEHNIMRAVREDLPKHHTADDCMKQITEALRLVRRAVSNITDAALISDNGDGLYLAVWKGNDCIYLADFSRNPEEAGKCLADIYHGTANETEVCFNWEEGDFVSDLAQLWGTDGSRAEVTCEHRRRIIEGHEWMEDETKTHLLVLHPLTAGGGAEWHLEDYKTRRLANVSHGDLGIALRAASVYNYPVQE